MCARDSGGRGEYENPLRTLKKQWNLGRGGGQTGSDLGTNESRGERMVIVDEGIKEKGKKAPKSTDRVALGGETSHPPRKGGAPGCPFVNGALH